jgi:hypothetical protein
VQCSTVQKNTVQYSAEQQSTVQNNTVQYSTIQYKTVTACCTKSNQLSSCPFLEAAVKQETEMHMG